jgi:hypothetical protein
MDGCGARAADRLASAAFSRHLSAWCDGMARLLKRTERYHSHTLPTCCRFDSGLANLVSDDQVAPSCYDACREKCRF